jgi:putative membrane protein
MLQIALLWAWHLPAVQIALAHSHVLSFPSHGLLFASALFFWIALLQLDGARCWHGVLGLLVTGKLFCLLAALLVFAPRAIYGAHPAPLLADQQLAGLLMIVACPLSYVLAGIVLTVQLIRPVQRRSHANAQA